MGRAPGTAPLMGRAQDNAQDDTAQETPEQERETVHGMGVSSEHDQGEVQEVDSRESE